MDTDPASYGITDTMERMYSDAQFAGSSSVPDHVEMIGVFLELDRNIISQRVKSGVANARANGKVVGRPTLKLSDIPKKVIETYEL
ncbi:Resolvase [human gut metagenome]|uniref:Resolvase n=1 Tax=human gut metagenome TaxID=408170 RepID=W1WNM5_9ZZZZ